VLLNSWPPQHETPTPLDQAGDQVAHYWHVCLGHADEDDALSTECERVDSKIRQHNDIFDDLHLKNRI
jgi:hypothetical protein